MWEIALLKKKPIFLNIPEILVELIDLVDYDFDCEHWIYYEGQSQAI